MAYFFLFGAFVLNSLANLLLKLGAQKGFVLTSFRPLFLLTNNWQFILGCLFFIANVPLYFLSLKYLPLSVAYPIMVIMSFILVNILAVVFLHEVVNLVQFCGYVLLIGGLLLVTLN